MAASFWLLSTAYTPSVVRVVRSTVLSIREREFIEASRSAGDSALETIVRHVLPNMLPPVVVLATSLFGWAMLSESALSFLGRGRPASRADVGQYAVRVAPLHGRRGVVEHRSRIVHCRYLARDQPAGRCAA